MKKIVFFLITICIAHHLMFGQWEIVNEGLGLEFRSIDFINVNTAWIWGNNIYQTLDGGKRYNSNKIIDFYNDTIWWAISEVEGSSISKTYDSGKTWIRKRSGKASFNKIYAISDTVVYIIGDTVIDAFGKTIILRTEDDGSTWRNIFPDSEFEFDRNSAYFFNADIAVIFCSKSEFTGEERVEKRKFFRSFDGGSTWDFIETDFAYIRGLKFLSDSVGYFRASKTDLWSNDYHIYKTTDAFNSWKLLIDTALAHQGFSFRHACHFLSNDSIISIMQANDKEYLKIVKSIDGGLTWDYVSDMKLPANWDYQFYFFNNIGYLLAYRWGSSNLIMKTIDQGNTWTVLKFQTPFRDVCFVNEKTGFFTSAFPGWHFSYTNLIKTSDGCKTIDFINHHDGSHDIDALCYFISESIGFYSTYHDGAPLNKTLDGGNSWIADGSKKGVSAMDFVNDSTGYICISGYWQSNTNGIYKTTNRGETWDIIYQGVGDAYWRTIFFIDEGTGWAVFNPGIDQDDIILKYTEKNGWTELIADIRLPIEKILFINHDLGWISGGYSNEDGFKPLFMRTVDGGETWTKVSDLPYLINDFHFTNSKHGWAVGEDQYGMGIILQSSDSGLSWRVVSDSLSGGLYALDFADGVGWAVGDNGLILRNNNPYTSLPEPNTNWDNSNILLQNYPNPFRGKTVISYRLSVIGMVEINIYDFTGRKVTTIINETQPPGSHEVEWNAADFKPGIYFCELRTGQSRVVQKMILLE